MLFRETVTGPRWLAIAGVATLVFLAVVTAIAAPVVVGNADRIGGWVLALLIVAFFLIFGAGLMGLTRRMAVSVSETHVDARLTPFRVMHIPLAQIEDVDVTEVTPVQAGGVGWRIVGSDRFVLWSAGSAVRLRLTSGGSRVIRTDRADELSAAITTRQARMR
ncbi:hypothetical protein [Microbacterium foliorum]|uniref:hypothetical protein n=1 Tax=Microbacterium foliorum TaxID=104336 RepID=UPI0028D510A8|nr:hypothetical protein [Microbacterium foliorum]